MNFSRAFMISALLALAMVLPALAQSPIVGTNEKGGNLATKQGNLSSSGPLNNPQGIATTVFNFHPEKTDPAPFNKLIPGQGGTIGLYLPQVETHGTDGSATYALNFTRTKTQITTKGTVTAEIQPGAGGSQVSINAGIKDPFAFSDTDPNAAFAFVPFGMDYSFSLFAGTSFPNHFAADLNSPGALADGTSMIYQGRVMPGVVGDPDAFWSNHPDALDLYNLTLTTDSNDNISAHLMFGESNSNFLLDFRDDLGQPFDPADPLAVSRIKSLISSSFSGGILPVDLNNIFTVGFVPTFDVNSFTMGTHDQLNIAGTEPAVPEPSSLSLVLVAFVLSLAAAGLKTASDRDQWRSSK